MISNDVSVVIPTRNRRDLLLRTLRSVLRQRNVSLSIVVVDDAGTDGSADAVHALGDRRVRVISHSKCRGVSQARNTGIDHVDSAWVAFADDDDLWSPDKLLAQLAALKCNPDAQWACTGAAHIDSTCRVLLAADPPPGPDLSSDLLRGNVIPGGGSGVLAATALVQQIGGFDVALSNLADWDFYIRLSQHSPVAAVTGPLLGYHIHTGGMAHDTGRSEREFRYIEAKYANERRARGVRLDRQQWLSYLAAVAYNGGHRMRGARLHLQAARHGRLRSLRSVATALFPDHVRVKRGRRAVDQIPAEWLADAHAWLAEYTARATAVAASSASRQQAGCGTSRPSQADET